MKTKYFISWWNLENLFDIRESTNRENWLSNALAKELKGWTDSVLQQKINQLCSVIRQMNENKGPDLLGVCEVENKPVIERLLNGLSPLGRDYGIVHHDMSDKRGIDVAFIYDKTSFIAEESFSHIILKRTATRDLFQVNFRTLKKKNPLIVIGNHWPARSAGVLESEPYRILAAETLSYWIQRIAEIRGNDTPVIVMGDFNDEPFNRSVTDYALASGAATNVIYARNARLFNLMWPLSGKAAGTFYFNNYPMMIDQFMVTKALIKSNGKIRIAEDESGYLVKIEHFSEMISKGRYPNPLSFGRPAKKSTFNPDGYSDHFPISMVIEE